MLVLFSAALPPRVLLLRMTLRMLPLASPIPPIPPRVFLASDTSSHAAPQSLVASLASLRALQSINLSFSGVGAGMGPDGITLLA
eukprot:1072314-Rhodomonas_salina.1